MCMMHTAADVMALVMLLRILNQPIQVITHLGL